MENLSKNKMGTAPMFRLILSMSLPAMFSMLIQSMYNVVDSVFVAQIGESALTAVSLAFPIQTLIIAVSVGTGVGINSLVSRRLGEGKQEEANQAASHGIALGIFSWILFAVLGILFTRVFFESFTRNAEIVSMGCDYVYVVTIMSFGMFIQVNMEKTLQATGNMIYPMLFQLIGALTNIILDPIMIFGWFGFPKLGVLGAAIATVCGQILAMIFSLYVIFRKSHSVHISFKGFKLSWETIKNIYAVGFPAIIMQAISSVLVMALNTILIAFSETAVALLGIYFKLQSFVFMPVFGLNQGIMPVMGFNYGAGNKKRLISALKIGSLIALFIMVLGTALFLLIPKQLLMIFNASPELLEIGIPALRTISLCFPAAALSIVFSTLFQAVGMGGKSLFISIIRQIVIILPAAYLFSKIGLQYVWFAFPLAECIALILSFIIFYLVYSNHLKELS